MIQFCLINLTANKTIIFFIVLHQILRILEVIYTNILIATGTIKMRTVVIVVVFFGSFMIPYLCTPAQS